MSKSTTKQCSVNECDRPHYARSVCNLHYQRLRKTGSLEEVIPLGFRRDELGRKRCSVCKEWLPEDRFYNHPDAKDGKRSACITCSKGNNLRTKYGMTLEQFQQMLQDQDNACGICKQPFLSSKDANVDHDHACCSGKKSCGECVRQLLCKLCNTGLGNFQDNPALLLAAVEYLNRNKR